MSAAQGRIDELQNCLTVQPSFSCQEKKLCVMASQLPGTPPIHHISKYSSQLLGTPPIHHSPKYCLQLLGTISIHHIKNKFKKKPAEAIKKKKIFPYLPWIYRENNMGMFLTEFRHFYPQPVLINNFSIRKHNPAYKKRYKISFPKVCPHRSDNKILY